MFQGDGWCMVLTPTTTCQLPQRERNLWLKKSMQSFSSSSSFCWSSSTFYHAHRVCHIFSIYNPWNIHNTGRFAKLFHHISMLSRYSQFGLRRRHNSVLPETWMVHFFAPHNGHQYTDMRDSTIHYNHSCLSEWICGMAE